MTLLLISHVSALDEALREARSLSTDGGDLLVYGQGHEGVDPPDGWRLISAPPAASAHRPLAALRWLRSRRRRRYRQALIAHPHLATSRGRGPLLTVGYVLGARAVRVFDPASGGPPGLIGRARAATDLAAWLALQPLCLAAAWITTVVLDGLNRVPAPSPKPIADALGPEAIVVYLRTDLDLAVAPLQAGGSAAHTEGVIRAMLRRGCDVTLFSTGEIAGTDDVRRIRLPTLRAANVPTEILELGSGLRQALARRQADVRTDLVYQRYSLNNLSGLAMARRAGVPFVLEVNASEVAWRSQWGDVRYPRLAAACERLVLQRADRCAVVSRNAARELSNHVGGAERVRVIPNGVDFRRFADVPATRLPFPESSLVIGFAGLFYPWHGVPTLVRAFARVAARRSDARLLLVGDGGDGAQVRAILRSAELVDRAHLTGLVRRDEVPGLLKSCDVLTAPHAGIDGFIGSPVKLFEYMASGAAIVASRVGQLGEILEHERNALLVRPDDPDELADALVRLAEDPGLRERLRSAAQADAEAHHSWDARLAALIDD